MPSFRPAGLLPLVVLVCACRSRKDECQDLLPSLAGPDFDAIAGDASPPKTAADVVAAADRASATLRALKLTGDLLAKAGALATAIDDVRAHTDKFRATGSPFGAAGASLANTGLTGKYAEAVQALLAACTGAHPDPACTELLAANGEFMKAHPGKTVSAVCSEIGTGLEAAGAKAVDPHVKGASVTLASSFRDLEFHTRDAHVSWDDFQATSKVLMTEQSASGKARAAVKSAAADIRSACGR